MTYTVRLVSTGERRFKSGDGSEHAVTKRLVEETSAQTLAAADEAIRDALDAPSEPSTKDALMLSFSGSGLDVSEKDAAEICDYYNRRLALFDDIRRELQSFLSAGLPQFIVRRGLPAGKNSRDDSYVEIEVTT